MIQIISTVAWIVLIVGVVLIMASFLIFKRKGEFELSSNVTETPTFRIGAIAVAIAILARIILAVAF